MALFSARNLLTLTLLTFVKKDAGRNFHQQNDSLSSTRGYFQINSGIRSIEKIQKRRTLIY